MELLPWGFAYLRVSELLGTVDVAVMPQEAKREMWYHACQALQRQYPFVPLSLRGGGWEATYRWYDMNLGTFCAQAQAALAAGLRAVRLPPAAAAARQFLRLHRLHKTTSTWDARLLSAAGCVTYGVPAPQGGAEARAQALAAGAHPDATFSVDAPFYGRAADYGCPPLYFAMMAGDVGMVQMLLAAGAGVQKVDRNGGTPLEYARQRSLLHPQCAAALAIVAARSVNKNEGMNE